MAVAQQSPGWGPMQQPLCLVRRAGTGMALSLWEITQRLRGPAGRRGGHPHPKRKCSRDKHLLGETSWKGQLQAGKGDVGPEGCSLCTTAMAVLAPPVLCLLASIPVQYSVIRHKGLCQQTGCRGHRQRGGRLCLNPTHKPGERCWAEPPLPGPPVENGPRSGWGSGRGFSLPMQRLPGPGTQH